MNLNMGESVYLTDTLWEMYCKGKIGETTVTNFFPTRIDEKTNGRSEKDLTDEQLGALRLGLYTCVNATLELGVRLFAIDRYIKEVVEEHRHMDDFRKHLYYFLLKKSMYPAVEVGIRWVNNVKNVDWKVDVDSAELYDSKWLMHNDHSPFQFFADGWHYFYGSRLEPEYWITMAYKIKDDIDKQYDAYANIGLDWRRVSGYKLRVDDDEPHPIDADEFWQYKFDKEHGGH